MDCPECEEPCVEFAVPADLREYAPEGASAAAICPVCLRTFAVEAGEETPDFAPLAEFFPADGAGVPLALALGNLGSLALNRTAIETLLARAEAEGADVLLALDRLAAAGSVQPHFDIDRRRVQVAQVLTE
jgi:hypothetical protein